MSEVVIIDGVFALKKKLGQGGMAAVFLADVDLTRFDYTTLYAYTQVQGETHVERRRKAEELAEKLAGQKLDLATVRAILEAQNIPVPAAQVAVKVAKSGDIDVARFEAEWKNLMCLNHENVVKVYGGGIYMKRPYYAMELLRGLVPPERISDRFTIRQKLEIVAQAGKGLQYLHDNGIVHRDVKPDNMVTCEVEPGRYVTKVTDLGIAKNLGDDLGLTMSQSVMGTPYYMSPEQVASSKHVDARADIYSLGASLYELVTGKKPFHDKTTVYGIIYAISQGEMPVPPKQHVPKLPDTICGIIECAMARVPEFRYNRVSELTADLERYLAEENTQVTGSITYLEVHKEQSSAAAGGGRYHFEAIRQKAEQAKLAAAPPLPPPPLPGPRVSAVAQLQAMRGRPLPKPAMPKAPGAGKKVGKKRLLIAGGVAAAVAVVVVVVLLSGGQKAQPQPPAHPGGGTQAQHSIPSGLPAKATVPRTSEEMHAALRARNPSYTGKAQFRWEGDRLIEAGLKDCSVSDLSPLSGQPIQLLWAENDGVLDLKCLAGMPLTTLSIDGNPVKDLTPISGAPLTSLYCGDTRVGDLSALKGMPLTRLKCWNCGVSDLSPLRGVPLKILHMYGNRVKDLAPLEGAHLEWLDCGANQITDLSPLKGMPITTLGISGLAVRDLSLLSAMPLNCVSLSPGELRCDIEFLRNHKTLKFIMVDRPVYLPNRSDLPPPEQCPAAEFWRRYDAGEFGKLVVAPPGGPKAPLGFKAVAGTVAEPYTNTGWAKGIVHEATGIEMAYIPAGEFMMGSPAAEIGRDGGETQHQVKLTTGFYLGKYEVTQGQWAQVMGNNPSGLRNAGKAAPVEQVSWDDCQAFIGKLNQPANAGAFRLPTEAEWEYACRGGKTTSLNSGKEVTTVDGVCPNLGEVAWYSRNSDGTSHPVGQKPPNAWGLYDMHGNVGEWCSDWAVDYPAGPVTDPTGPAAGKGRLRRGGAWSTDVKYCRAAFRDWARPDERLDAVGCRLAFAPAQEPPQAALAPDPKWAEGCVLAYSFGKDTMLDRGGNTWVRDLSGAGNDGMLYGTKVAPGIAGDAFSFDGKGNYINCGKSERLKFRRDEPFTLMIWARDVGDKSHGGLFNDMAPTLRGLVLFVNRANISFQFVGDVAKGEVLTSVARQEAFTAGQWRHIALVYDGSGLAKGCAYYINGEKAATTPLAEKLQAGETRSAAEFRVGGQIMESPPGTKQDMFFQGDLDEAAVWRRALSAAEVKALYAYSKAGKGYCKAIGEVSAATRAPQLDGAALAKDCVLALAMGELAKGQDGIYRMPDSSPCKQDVKIRALTSMNDGERGRCISLSGSKIHGLRCDGAELDLRGEFAISLWVRASSNQRPDSWPTLVQRFDFQGKRGFTFGLVSQAMGGVPKDAAVFGVFGTDGAYHSTASRTLIADDAWHHLVSVYRRSSAEFYVDGKREGLSNWQPAVDVRPLPDMPFVLGAIGPGLGDGNYIGLMDEVAVWRRALSKDEVEALYAYAKDGKSYCKAIGAAAKVEAKPASSSSTAASVPPTKRPVLEFDGQRGLITVKHNATLDFRGDFTAEAWVCLRDIPRGGNGASILTRDSPGIGPWEFLITGDGKLKGGVACGNWHPTPEGAIYGPLPTAKWLHLAMVYDRRQVRTFVDGKRVASYEACDTLGVNTNNLKIGRNLYNGSTINGMIAEVRLSTAALYEQDFAPTARLNVMPSTIMLLHCDEGQGQTARDASGKGNNGIVEAGKWTEAIVGDAVPRP